MSAESRDCIEPWTRVTIYADGGVSLCCFSGRVGSLHDSSLASILDGEYVTAIKLGLLTGNLHDYCKDCPDKPYIDANTLMNKVAALFHKDANNMPM